MNGKSVYEAPVAESVEILVENCILDGSMKGSLSSYAKIYDEEEEWD